MTSLRKIIQELYWEREPTSLKSDFGKALLIGGSRAYPGAVLLALEFASISGDGYNALMVPPSIYPTVTSRAPLAAIYENPVCEEDSFLVSENEALLNKCFSTYTSILFGNGIAETEENYRFLAYILASYKGVLVIDATGLRLLARYGTAALKAKAKEITVLLTPHLGEAAGLFHHDLKTREPEAYEKDGIRYAKENGVYLLLKSYKSLLIEPTGKVFLSHYAPTPALGKAGSGDGLAGYLAGILAYGTKKENVTALVLFGDALIHEAAHRSERKKSSGLASILSAKGEIESIIEAANPVSRRGH